MDYAAVVLAGPELASFTARTDVRELMSPDTRAQLEAANELAKFVRHEGAAPGHGFAELLKKSPPRIADWKTYYDERVRSAIQNHTARIDGRGIAIADAESDYRVSGRPSTADRPIVASSDRPTLPSSADSRIGSHLRPPARWHSGCCDLQR